MKELLERMFQVAIDAADSEKILASFLPEDRTRKVTVIGAGKGAAKMAKAFEDCWQGEINGLVITRYGHNVQTRFIEVVEAAHPVPDQAGQDGAKRILDLVSNLDRDDLVIALISGGGSALLPLPVEGLSIEDKQNVNKALLQSGANIHEMNCVRKHLSAIKGGRLAKACYPAKLITYAISDVAGDDPDVIASGPTVGDRTTIEDARNILNRYGIEGYDNYLTESVFPDDPSLATHEYHLIATPQKSLDAIKEVLKNEKINVVVLSDVIEGEARELAKMHGAIVRQIIKTNEPFPTPCLLISGGEATVTLKNKAGRGGPNAEFLLSLLDYLQDTKGIYALCADTDGIDGSEDNAGAYISDVSYQKAQERGLNLKQYLDANLSYDFFKEMGDLFVSGPTLTNVNDLRMIYIDKSEV